MTTKEEMRRAYQLEWMRRKRSLEKAKRLLRQSFLEKIGGALDHMSEVEAERMKQRLLRIVHEERQKKKEKKSA